MGPENPGQDQRGGSGHPGKPRRKGRRTAGPADGRQRQQRRKDQGHGRGEQALEELAPAEGPARETEPGENGLGLHLDAESAEAQEARRRRENPGPGPGEGRQPHRAARQLQGAQSQSKEAALGRRSRDQGGEQGRDHREEDHKEADRQEAASGLPHRQRQGRLKGDRRGVGPAWLFRGRPSGRSSIPRSSAAPR